MKIEWKEEQCRTNSLQVATSQHFSCSFRIRSICIYTCMFHAVYRWKAWCCIFRVILVLGGSKCAMYAVQNKKTYVSLFEYIYVVKDINKLLETSWFQRSHQGLIFVGFPFKQNICFLVVPGNRPRWAKNWNGEPGKSRRKKENVATEQLVGFDGGMFCFFPHINRVCATIGFTVSWEARVFLNLRMTKNSEGISWIHPQRPNHCSNFDIVTIWVHHRQDYFVRGELGNRKSLGDLFSRWK